jgi:hypothetical protein
MYLMDPQGDFVTFYGKNFTAQQLADSICGWPRCEPAPREPRRARWPPARLAAPARELLLPCRLLQAST